MALWERLARVFGRGERSEAERILLEADFGVEATEECSPGRRGRPRSCWSSE